MSDSPADTAPAAPPSKPVDPEATPVPGGRAPQPPVDNDHVAPGATPFTAAEIAANAKPQEHAGVMAPPQPPLAQPPKPPAAPEAPSAPEGVASFPMPSLEEFIAEGFDPKDYANFVGALTRKRANDVAKAGGPGIKPAPVGGAPAGNPGMAQPPQSTVAPSQAHADHADLVRRHQEAKSLVAELEGDYLRAVQVAARLADEVRRSEGFLPTLEPAFFQDGTPNPSYRRQ